MKASHNLKRVSLVLLSCLALYGCNSGTSTTNSQSTPNVGESGVIAPPLVGAPPPLLGGPSSSPNQYNTNKLDEGTNANFYANDEQITKVLKDNNKLPKALLIQQLSFTIKKDKYVALGFSDGSIVVYKEDSSGLPEAGSIKQYLGKDYTRGAVNALAFAEGYLYVAHSGKELISNDSSWDPTTLLAGELSFGFSSTTTQQGSQIQVIKLDSLGFESPYTIYKAPDGYTVNSFMPYSRITTKGGNQIFLFATYSKLDNPTYSWDMSVGIDFLSPGLAAAGLAEQIFSSTLDSYMSDGYGGSSTGIAYFSVTPGDASAWSLQEIYLEDTDKITSTLSSDGAMFGGYKDGKVVAVRFLDNKLDSHSDYKLKAMVGPQLIDSRPGKVSLLKKLFNHNELLIVRGDTIDFIKFYKDGSIDKVGTLATFKGNEITALTSNKDGSQLFVGMTGAQLINLTLNKDGESVTKEQDIPIATNDHPVINIIVSTYDSNMLIVSVGSLSTTNHYTGDIYKVDITNSTSTAILNELLFNDKRSPRGTIIWGELGGFNPSRVNFISNNNIIFTLTGGVISIWDKDLDYAYTVEVSPITVSYNSSSGWKLLRSAGSCETIRDSDKDIVKKTGHKYKELCKIALASQHEQFRSGFNLK